MEIRDYIKEYYFENIVEKLDPEYDTMVFNFDSENKLINVVFRNKADNNIYYVKYRYNKANRITDETLKIIKKNIDIDPKFGNKSVLCRIKYRYTKNSIKVIKKGYCEFINGRIYYNIPKFKKDNILYMKEYDQNGYIIGMIDYGWLDFKEKFLPYQKIKGTDIQVKSYYKYNSTGNIISRYLLHEDMSTIRLSTYYYDNDNNIAHILTLFNDNNEYYIYTLHYFYNYKYNNTRHIIYKWHITNQSDIRKSLNNKDYSSIEKFIDRLLTVDFKEIDFNVPSEDLNQCISKSVIYYTKGELLFHF